MEMNWNSSGYSGSKKKAISSIKLPRFPSSGMYVCVSLSVVSDYMRRHGL